MACPGLLVAFATMKAPQDDRAGCEVQREHDGNENELQFELNNYNARSCSLVGCIFGAFVSISCSASAARTYSAIASDVGVES